MKFSEKQLKKIIQEELAEMTSGQEIDEAFLDFLTGKSKKNQQELNNEQMKEKIDSVLRTVNELWKEAIKQKNGEISRSIRLTINPMLKGLYKEIPEDPKQKIQSTFKTMASDLKTPLKNQPRTAEE